jgi:hypothetical protein
MKLNWIDPIAHVQFAHAAQSRYFIMLENPDIIAGALLLHTRTQEDSTTSS